MVGGIGQLFFVLLSTIALLHNRLGSALKIEISPETGSLLVTEQVKVQCLLGDTANQASKIVSIELGKAGEQSLVVLKEAKLEQGVGIQSNMKADGRIDLENRTQSFVKVTINRPQEKDAGEYECKVFYVDRFGDLRDKTVHASLDSNIYDVILQLKKELSSLKKKAEEQEKKVESLIAEQSRRSAFLASVNENGKRYSLEKTAHYDWVNLNVGGDYSTATGLYTAPVHGLYVFHLLATSYLPAAGSQLDIRVNGVAISDMYARDDKHTVGDSMSVVTELKKGDIVDVYVRDLIKGGEGIDPFPLTAFCGYLLHSL